MAENGRPSSVVQDEMDIMPNPPTRSRGNMTPDMMERDYMPDRPEKIMRQPPTKSNTGFTDMMENTTMPRSFPKASGNMRRPRGGDE